MGKKARRYPELTALKGKIRERGTSYRKIADHIVMGVNTLSDKINGYYAFDGPEIEVIAEFLELDPVEIPQIFFPTYCKTHQEIA